MIDMERFNKLKAEMELLIPNSVEISPEDPFNPDRCIIFRNDPDDKIGYLYITMDDLEREISIIKNDMILKKESRDKRIKLYPVITKTLEKKPRIHLRDIADLYTKKQLKEIEFGGIFLKKLVHEIRLCPLPKIFITEKSIEEYVLANENILREILIKAKHKTPSDRYWEDGGGS